MSRTTVKGLWAGEDRPPVDLAEFANSWGSAPVVWDALAQRYLSAEPYAYYQNMELLWCLHQSRKVAPSHRAVLVLTFDHAYVRRKDYARMADDVDAFLCDFPPVDGHSNHWAAIAALLRADPDVPAVGLHCTSASPDPFLGSYDEVTETHAPFDWTTALDVYKTIGGRTT